jgi:hypothetical protein
MDVDTLLHSLGCPVIIRLQQKLDSTPPVMISIYMEEQVASFAMYTVLMMI